MSKVNTYSIKGIHLAPTTLPKDFDAKENLNLLAQAIRVYQEEAHIGLAKAKTRAEVNRTKKKWYKQKGTGGARHGARSAPIFVGGGVAHGPRPVKRHLTLPKRMARKALQVALGLKVKKAEVVVVEGLAKITKTKEACVLINKIKATGRCTFVLSDENLAKAQFLKNIENVDYTSYKSLNAYRVFFAGTIILDKEIFGQKTPKLKNSKIQIKTATKKEVEKK